MKQIERNSIRFFQVACHIDAIFVIWFYGPQLSLVHHFLRSCLEANLSQMNERILKAKIMIHLSFKSLSYNLADTDEGLFKSRKARTNLLVF